MVKTIQLGRNAVRNSITFDSGKGVLRVGYNRRSGASRFLYRDFDCYLTPGSFMYKKTGYRERKNFLGKWVPRYESYWTIDWSALLPEVYAEAKTYAWDYFWSYPRTNEILDCVLTKDLK